MSSFYAHATYTSMYWESSITLYPSLIMGITHGKKCEYHFSCLKNINGENRTLRPTYERTILGLKIPLWGMSSGAESGGQGEGAAPNCCPGRRETAGPGPRIPWSIQPETIKKIIKNSCPQKRRIS